MIYRGEIYYGEHQTTVFVVYGTSKYVAAALHLAGQTLERDPKYEYITLSQHNVFRYWFETVRIFFLSRFEKAE